MRTLPLLLMLVSPVLAQHSDPAEQLRVAVQKQERGEYASAIRDYREILKVHPDMVEAKVDLGAALSDTGQYDEAISLFKDALRSGADKKPALMNLALAYFRKGDLPRARQQLLELHQKYSGDEKAIRLLAEVDLRDRKPSEAIALLEPLDSAHTDDMDFQLTYGTALIAAGRTKEGVLRVQKVAEIANRADAYMIAGSTLLRLDQAAIAREDLERAWRLDPKLPGLRTLVGIAQDKTGDPEGAESTLREALRMNEGDFEGNLTLGAILYKRRALDEASIYLERALQLKPQDQTARFEWGMLKIARGEYALGAEVLAQLAREAPDWLDPHVALAKAYYQLHRPADGERERKIVEHLTGQRNAPKVPE